ncbi:MAG: hypothetical protein ACRD9S_07780 [Pyrinomonadaceae bacterium]
MTSQSKRFVIGIPTVGRPRAYLLQTVASLIRGMSDVDRERSRIVIFDAEDEAGANPSIAKLTQTWPALIASEFITVLRREEPLELNPAGLSLKEHWQRKQTLDCAELFRRCGRMAEYYVHVEDDVIACPNFLDIVDRRLESHLSRNTDWRVLSFYNSHKMHDDASYSELQLDRHYFGLIGQLIRCDDLNDLACYVCSQFERLPVDVLVGRFVLNTGGRVYAHTPALFQHVGLISSLQGRTQMWTAPQFPEAPAKRLRREMRGLHDVLIYQPRSLGAFLKVKFGSL